MPAADQQECHQRKQLRCGCNVSPPTVILVILHDWIVETTTETFKTQMVLVLSLCL